VGVRDWWPKSLEVVEVRKLSTQEETDREFEFEEVYGFDEDETVYGRCWVRRRMHFSSLMPCDIPDVRDTVHTVILSPPFAWHASDAMNVVKGTDVTKVTSFKITANEDFNLDEWIDSDDEQEEEVPVRSLETIEAAINVKQINSATIHALHTLRKYCVHPDAEADYSSSTFDFEFRLLWFPIGDIGRLFSEEGPVFGSSTLVLAASLATSVTFPTRLEPSFVILAIPQAFYSLLPKLVFSSARTLNLSSSFLMDRPLPQPLLFHLGRLFPSVRCVDLGKGQQLGEEAVVKVIDDLPSLRMVRFARRLSYRGPYFFLPSCLRKCTGDGPALHVKGSFRSRVDGSESWSLWDGEEEGDESSEDDIDSAGEADGGRKDGIERRIRRITVYFSAGYASQPEKDAEEEEWIDRERPAFEGLFATCIKAITTLPKLERITLSTDDVCPLDFLHQGGRHAVESRLSRHGFVAVQTGTCRVELHREGLPVTEGQRLITDYFPPLSVAEKEMDE